VAKSTGSEAVKRAGFRKPFYLTVKASLFELCSNGRIQTPLI